jgi:hypothetical protein
MRFSMFFCGFAFGKRVPYFSELDSLNGFRLFFSGFLPLKNRGLSLGFKILMLEF